MQSGIVLFLSEFVTFVHIAAISVVYILPACPLLLYVNICGDYLTITAVAFFSSVFSRSAGGS